MKESKEYKPLWRIRNATYRRYAKGLHWERIRRYVRKTRQIFKL